MPGDRCFQFLQFFRTPIGFKLNVDVIVDLLFRIRSRNGNQLLFPVKTNRHHRMKAACDMEVSFTHQFFQGYYPVRCNRTYNLDGGSTVVSCLIILVTGPFSSFQTKQSLFSHRFQEKFEFIIKKSFKLFRTKITLNAVRHPMEELP